MPDTILIKASKVITLYYCHMVYWLLLMHPYFKSEDSTEFQNYRKRLFLVLFYRLFFNVNMYKYYMPVQETIYSGCN